MKGTYKLLSRVVLTADRFDEAILFADNVEIRPVDILASLKNDVSTVKLTRFAAVVTLGNA